MDAQEVLRRVKATAQASQMEAKELYVAHPLASYYAGKAEAFQHIVELIESLEDNRWEKKAREVLAPMPAWGPPGDGWTGEDAGRVAQALSEAYEEGFQQGQEHSGRRSADR